MNKKVEKLEKKIEEKKPIVVKKESSFKKKKKVKRNITSGIAYVYSTFNNTIISIPVDPPGEIGKDCIIRENVTIHSGTKQSKSITKVGNNCFLMVDSHVAHDCMIGDHVILINQATLAGHTSVGDYAIIGGLSALHQHVRIGKHAFIAGMTGVEQDILPYGLAKGMLRRCYLTGVNITGLKRRGFSKETIFIIS